MSTSPYNWIPSTYSTKSFFFLFFPLGACNFLARLVGGNGQGARSVQARSKIPRYLDELGNLEGANSCIFLWKRDSSFHGDGSDQSWNLDLGSSGSETSSKFSAWVLRSSVLLISFFHLLWDGLCSSLLVWDSWPPPSLLIYQDSPASSFKKNPCFFLEEKALLAVIVLKSKLCVSGSRSWSRIMKFRRIFLHCVALCAMV